MGKEEQMMLEIRQVFNKMAWLNKLKMEKALAGHSPSEVHCIEYIGKHPETNVTQLATAFFMTKGAISKLTQKLINKKLIVRYQKKENKKEVYFCLTDKGHEIFDIHEKLHQEFRQRDKEILDELTPEQIDKVLSFTERYSQHLDLEIAKKQFPDNK
ncbi:MarR family winged helix-turn-helix transcriptional regulator [Vagococcus entomophilus]|uniref:MarR family transcriptional regulator n=1 Tax=Vagococcus entomophilus TaxID=1160095 RepID=A0A430AI25_9ENTE|nr:MarR family transcriptional regulator [Vagococcus entomophilus]RSU07735.1 MarR family transcriptional regulator [Vagococcus entomophilus]